VPDEPIQADEASADAQGAGGEPSYDRSWLIGEPDPARVVTYASKLREEKAALKQRLAEQESVWEDEEAAVARFAEKFPNRVVDDSEEEPDEGQGPEYEDGEDDDPVSALERRIAAQEEREQKREQAQEAQAFQSQWTGWEDYVKSKVPEGTRELTAWELKALKVDSVGKDGWPVTPDKAEKQLKTFLKERDEYDSSIVENYRQSKRAPNRPPEPGKAGEVEFDRKSATPEQRREQRQARIAALDAAARQQ
jgi:hypothetical protein